MNDRSPQRRPLSLLAALALALTPVMIALPVEAADGAPDGEAIPNSQYAVLDFDSESPPYPAPPAIDGTAASAFDGDYSTQWGSWYTDGAPDPLPHWLTFDIGETQLLTGLGLLLAAAGTLVLRGRRSA